MTIGHAYTFSSNYQAVIALVALPHQTTLGDHIHDHQEDYSGIDAKLSRLYPLQHRIFCMLA
jgi:hypothetical protein